ncbi:dodecin domain-containing protein [bacterium]|nr:dodecin domain-containing protein [bacterium]
MPNSVYKVIEVIGTSDVSWEDAAQRAIATASKSLEHLRIASVTAQDLKIEDGKVVAYRTRLSLSFKIMDK